jgi:hypothetical protein
VLAIADGDKNFVKWNKRLQRMDEISDAIRNRASHDKRIELRKQLFTIACEFLGTIGVTFGHSNVGGQWIMDPDKPLVPEWDFDSMIVMLKKIARSLKYLPAKPIDHSVVEEAWVGPPVSPELCERCIFSRPCWHCALGRPVQWLEEEAWMATDKCDAFKPLPVVLRRQQPTENQQIVGSEGNEMLMFIEERT